MKQNKTNLGKRVHVYRSLEDMEKQFGHDVKTAAKPFVDLVEKTFDMKNPYDQVVLEAILTNLLAYVEVYAEMDNVNMVESMRTDFENSLTMYRKEAKQKKLI